MELIDRYERHMIIESVISDAIDFFHMDVLSAAVPIKISVDAQLTIMASVLYRMLGVRVGQGFEVAQARTMHHKLIPTMATVMVSDDEIVVTYAR